MVNVLVASFPGLPFQVPMAKHVDEYFRLIEPGSVHGRIPATPPSHPGQVSWCCVRGMAGVTILDQKDAVKVRMPLPKLLESLNVMSGVFALQDHRFHPTRMNH